MTQDADDAVERALLNQAVHQIQVDIRTNAEQHKADLLAAEQRIEAKLDKVVFEARLKPVERIVFGLVALILSGVGYAVINIVTRGGTP